MELNSQRGLSYIKEEGISGKRRACGELGTKEYGLFGVCFNSVS